MLTCCFLVQGRPLLTALHSNKAKIVVHRANLPAWYPARPTALLARLSPTDPGGQLVRQVRLLMLHTGERANCAEYLGFQVSECVGCVDMSIHVFVLECHERRYTWCGWMRLRNLFMCDSPIAYAVGMRSSIAACRASRAGTLQLGHDIMAVYGGMQLRHMRNYCQSI